MSQLDPTMAVATQIRNSNCPQCQGQGPLDIFQSHTIISFVVMSTYKSTPQLSCKPCASKKQTTALISSLLLGWWGFPWGLIITPIQIVRNIVGLTTPVPATPSLALLNFARGQAARFR